MISVGGDHAGWVVKKQIMGILDQWDEVYVDCNLNYNKSDDYPQIADKVVANVLTYPGSKGILVCGTGIGISIRANRYKGIRAALCTDEIMALRSRQHNDANILVVNSELTNQRLLRTIMQAFFRTVGPNWENDGERHLKRIEQLDEELYEPEKKETT